ncbi:MAG: HNH endonuclease [Actinomycetota bacterium]|nr:HNH endonuclease [Actinomycetota bacterium]
MRRSSPTRRTPLRHGRPPARRVSLKRRAPLTRHTPLARRPFAPASPAQRAKVKGERCLVCNKATRIDPAHLVPRARGGCDEALCVIALCRPCHRLYDSGGLDLVAYLEPGLRAEAAHAVGHLGLAGALRRISGTRG